MKKSLLLLAVFVTASLKGQVCFDLFISEYVEGPAQNNGIEIYNPTNASIDLSGYTVNRYSNGASANPEVWPLSGMIAAGDVIVLGNGQLDSIDLGTYWSVPVDPAFYALLDDHCTGDYNANSTFYFNGDDAMTLEKNGTIVDIFGKVGEDPGGAWTDDASAGYTDANGGNWWTKRQTLVRKSSVQTGVTQNPLVFNPTLEYDSLPDATYSGLGAHNCDCNTTDLLNYNKHNKYIIYPNPVKQGSNINIGSNSKVETITVFDISGKEIMNSYNYISSLNLSKGTYILRVNFLDGESIENKLIVE